jgi:tryptophan-rich sensory protein
MDTLKHIGQFVASILVAFAAAGIGSLATIPNIPTWYAGLDKPPLLPPNEVFGPVWSVLYLMMGIALFLVWIAHKSPKQQPLRVYGSFFAQLALNALWSLVFFALHLPWVSFVIIIALIGAIIWTMREFVPISKPAMWLLAPYLAWTCFATYLTVGVAVLN